MNDKEIQTMLKLAREAGNFRELRRLEKIVKFNDPNFKYPTNRGQKMYLRRSLFEIVKQGNSL